MRTRPKIAWGRLDLRAARGRAIRRSHEEALAEATQELNVERDRRASLPGLQKQRANLASSIAKDKRGRSTLIGKGGEERAKRLDVVATAAEAVRFQVEQARRRRQALIALRDEVADTRATKAPARLRQLQQAHAEARLPAEAWKAFLLDFAGDVDGILSGAITVIDNRIRALSGPAAGEATVAPGAPPSTASLLPDGVALEILTLSLLEKEVARLRALIGIDTEKARALARLSEKISRDDA